MDACFRHSLTEKRRDDRGTMNEKDRKLAMALLSAGEEKGTEGFDPRRVRALDDFSADLCDSFAEYGAQYGQFGHCVRLLLRPGFPTSTRCRVLSRLRGLLHLLTPEEGEDEGEGEGESLDDHDPDSAADSSSVVASLVRGVSGGLPSRDGTKRDPPELLDAFSDALKGEGGNPSPSSPGGGYFYAVAVAHLARNLASAAEGCEGGLEAMRRRMEVLGRTVRGDVISVAEKLLAGEGKSKIDLIEAVLHVRAKGRESGCMITEQTTMSWELTCNLLRAVTREK